MRRVPGYCQISGCIPDVECHIKWDPNYADEYGPIVRAALRLLTSDDEAEGRQTLSIIGALDESDNALWNIGDTYIPTLEEALALPESSVRVLHGCSMGNMFDYGFCDGPVGRGGDTRISRGCCFYAITNMLPILEAATGGRVSPRRLWDLVMSRGYFDSRGGYRIPGVDYGPTSDHLSEIVELLGILTTEEVGGLEGIGTPSDIGDVLRDKGFWIWMRPDRFPIDSSMRASTFSTVVRPVKLTSKASIISLPLELLHSIASRLPLSSIIILARLNRTMYHQLLGSLEARDRLAKEYMRTQARWCLPFGEAELRWWNDRNGDNAIGWGYLKRCCSESYSMRNRRRVWRAAESIEEECEREEAKRANKVSVASA